MRSWHLKFLLLFAQAAMLVGFYALKFKFPLNNSAHSFYGIKIEDIPAGHLECVGMFLAAAFIISLWCIHQLELQGALSNHIVAALGFFLAGCGVCAVFTNALTSIDITYYIAYGRKLAILQLNPYATPIGDQAADPIVKQLSNVWFQMPCAYGPLALLVFAIVNLLSAANMISLILMCKGIWLICYGALIWQTAKVFSHGGMRFWRSATFALIGNPLMIWQMLIDGHVEVLVLIGLMMSWSFLQNRRWMLAGAFFAGACAVKMPMVLLLPFLAIAILRGEHGGRRAFGKFITPFSVLTILSLSLFGVSQFHALRILSIIPSNPSLVPILVQRLYAMLGGQSLVNPPVPSSNSFLMMNIVFLSVYAFLLSKVTRVPKTDSAMILGSIAISAFVATRYYHQPWYFLWCIPGLLFSISNFTSLFRSTMFVTIVFAIGVRSTFHFNSGVFALGFVFVLVSLFKRSLQQALLPDTKNSLQTDLSFAPLPLAANSITRTDDTNVA